MPDLLTHTLFSSMVFDDIKNEALKMSISKNLNLYRLGAQGPDFFFYYKPLSPFSRRISDLGRIMHQKNTADFFIGAINEIEKNEDHELFLVYLIGFLCHFYLDKNIHPYVDFIDRNGIWDFNGELHEMSHYYLEYTIDARLWKEYMNQEAIDVNLASLIRIENFPDNVLKYFREFFHDRYHIDVPEKRINASIKSMYQVLEILYDPHYRKRLLRKMPAPRRFYIHDPFPEYDVLNLNGNDWFYKGEDTPIKDSVKDLIKIAGSEASNTVNMVMAHLEGNEKIDLSLLIEDVSYNTNRKT